MEAHATFLKSPSAVMKKHAPVIVNLLHGVHLVDAPSLVEEVP